MSLRIFFLKYIVKFDEHASNYSAKITYLQELN